MKSLILSFIAVVGFFGISFSQNIDQAITTSEGEFKDLRENLQYVFILNENITRDMVYDAADTYDATIITEFDGVERKLTLELKQDNFLAKIAVQRFLATLNIREIIMDNNVTELEDFCETFVYKG